MHWATKTLAAVTMVALAQSVFASGMGAAIYQPAKVVKPVTYHAPTGCQTTCSDCQECSRIGFACVDHASPAPCSVEGGCKPKRATYGHYSTKWRRWPGDQDDVSPTPEEAAAGDELLPGYDPPPPSKEEEQAPPPIEDESDAEEGDEEESQLELSLPPLPQVKPGQRPAPALPRREQPEPEEEDLLLPFGATTPPAPQLIAPEGPTNELPPLPELPPSPEFPVQPAAHPAPEVKSLDDAPPPLPMSFTAARVTAPTRLPVVQASIVPSVSPVVTTSHESEAPVTFVTDR